MLFVTTLCTMPRTSRASVAVASSTNKSVPQEPRGQRVVRLVDQHVGDDLGVDVQTQRGKAVVPLELLRREEPCVGEAVDDLEQLAVRRRARRVARVARERDEPREAPRDVLER